MANGIEGGFPKSQESQEQPNKANPEKLPDSDQSKKGKLRAVLESAFGSLEKGWSDDFKEVI